MAVLLAQVSSSQGVFNSSSSVVTSNSTIPIGNYLNSLSSINGNVGNSLGQSIQSVLILIASNQYSQSNYINYLSRLSRFFGNNAKQTSTHLIIQKSDLPSLTPRLSNSAESLLTALLLRVMVHESNSLISTATVNFFRTEYLQGMINHILVLNLYVLVTRRELYEIVENNTIRPNNF